MSKPSNIDDAYTAVEPSMALEQDDERYVDFQDVRGENDEVGIMFRRINRTSNGFLCQLLTGHRGCGKTTELFRLKRKLEEYNFFVVYFDAEETLDISDLDYPDVLLAIAEQLEAQLREKAGISIKPELLESIAD
jgi:predicted AAA+ superfamily ATPase